MGSPALPTQRQGSAGRALVRFRRRFLRTGLPVVAAVIVLGGGGMAALETDTVGSFGDGVWWALSLMTTVGFTSGIPVTTAGKVLSGVLMVSGFVVLAMTTAAVASLFVREDEEPGEQRERETDRAILAHLVALGDRLEAIEQRFPEGPAERSPDL